MTPMYAALYDKNVTGAPTNCVWTKQLARPLHWFRTFFRSSGGFVQRCFSLRTFTEAHGSIEIVIDASPWALAGVLVLKGVVVEFFSDPIGSHDVDIFGCDIGSADGQQIWESLTALVALRLWKDRWANKAVHLRLKGDSVTMLTLVVNMRPSTPMLALIGQELALEFASVAFTPVIAQHIPGVSNVIADKLSRWHQPGAAKVVPSAIHGAVQRQVPTRDGDYYLSRK